YTRAGTVVKNVADAAGNEERDADTETPADGAGPAITNVAAPANATYIVGQDLDFTVTWHEAVTVAGGTPRIPLTIGVTTKYATYVSGSTTTQLVFRYTIVEGDLDANGIAMTSPLELNGGTIKDAAANNARLTYTAPNTTGVLVDGVS